VVRKAFTLIELIFAIVVIAISVMSLPMMNEATTEGISGNIVQEAIFAASTELNQAVTGNWDEASLEPGEPDSLARVIDDGTCENNGSLATFRQKSGHINQPLHRRCLDSNATTVSSSNSDDNITALNDMSKTNASLFDENVTSASGYKKLYTVTLSVDANATFVTGVNTGINVKKITATISDSTGVVTKLVSFSSNVGEIDFFTRTY